MRYRRCVVQAGLFYASIFTSLANPCVAENGWGWRMLRLDAAQILTFATDLNELFPLYLVRGALLLLVQLTSFIS